jgi:hypothetical protein
VQACGGRQKGWQRAQIRPQLSSLVSRSCLGAACLLRAPTRPPLRARRTPAAPHQVDGLVAYFDGLLSEDQAAIALLDRQVAEKDKLIEALRQGPPSPGPAPGPAPALRAPPKPWPPGPAPPAPFAEPAPTCCGRLADSCVARPRAWLCCVAVTVALLVLIIGLSAGLSVRLRNGVGGGGDGTRTPALLGAPRLLSAGNDTLDLQLVMERAGAVHYLVLPAAAAAAAGAASAGDVVSASAGLLSGSQLEVRRGAARAWSVCAHGKSDGGTATIQHADTPANFWHALARAQSTAVACGELPIPAALAASNATLSIVGRSGALECARPAGGAAFRSCARCPALQASTGYTVLLVPAAGGAVGAISRLQVGARGRPGCQQR